MSKPNAGSVGASRVVVCRNCDASVDVIGPRESRRRQLDQLGWRLGGGISAAYIADDDEDGYCCPRCSTETAEARVRRLADDVMLSLPDPPPHFSFRDPRGNFLRIDLGSQPVLIPFDLGMKDDAVRVWLREALKTALTRAD